MARTVGVIFGGVSNENEISVITGTMAANVLKKGGERVVAVYIAQNGKFYTGEELLEISAFRGEGYARCAGAFFAKGGIYVLNKRGKVKKFIALDAVLNCCHGGDGEGGAVCGACALADLPLASAGCFESAAFMDKYFTKLVLGALGVDILPYDYLRQGEGGACTVGFPAVVKPVGLGSSIGVERVENGEGLAAALEVAFTYDAAAIVEPCVQNLREINCAAYRGRAGVVTSECEEAFSSGGLLSFEDKYEGGGRSVLPADLPEELSRRVKEVVRRVYEGLNMRGIVRFDFLLEGDKLWLSEVNTVPGSLSYYLLSGGFGDFYAVLDEVLSQAQEEFRRKRAKKLLKTGVLENIPANACKRGTK